MKTIDFCRADFYLGLHEDATYLGSVLQNGSPWKIPTRILKSTTPEKYLQNINELLSDKAYRPQREWPHLWPDSLGTEYSYFFHNDRVLCSSYGDRLFDPIEILKGKTLLEAQLNIYPRMKRQVVKGGVFGQTSAETL